MKINLSEKAINQISKSLEKRGKGIGLRLGVKTSGCSGMSYKLEFVDNYNEDDITKEFNKFLLVVDSKSLPYLDGMTLDFVKEGLNEGFKFDNPNVKDQCGCGESFRV